jgi:hypothetical protein
MQDSDEDPDPEIRKPQQREFHELRREPKLAALQIKVQRQDPTRTRPPCAIPRTTNRIGETRVVEARIGLTRFLGQNVLSIGYNIDYT